MSHIKFLLITLFTILCIGLVSAETSYLCTIEGTYTPIELATGNDITPLTNLSTCTNAQFAATTCGQAYSRTVVCYDSTTDLIIDCVVGDEAQPATSVDYTCDYKCYLTTSTFENLTTPLAIGTNINTLPSSEQGLIGSCDVIPAITCSSTDIETPERNIPCIDSFNTIIESSLCTTSTPPTKRTDPACKYWCSSEPITVTNPADVDSETTAICTSTNFFPAPNCNPHNPIAKRYVGCERNGVIQSPCTIPNIDPELEPVESFTPKPSEDCHLFFFCANDNDQFVSCSTPNLVTTLCDPTTHPQQSNESCIPDTNDPSTGTFSRTFTTRCVAGLGCVDPDNVDAGFNEAFCTDIYQYQTTNAPCTNADITIPQYECPCEPQLEYRCAQSYLTLKELQQNPHLLVQCDNDAIFPTPDRVSGCDGFITTLYRNVICVDLDGTLELVPQDDDNTTACAATTAPSSSKQYTGTLDCTYTLKCAEYNQTVSDITLTSPDCPRYNSISPSPCFTQPQIDRFSLYFEEFPPTNNNNDDDDKNNNSDIQPEDKKDDSSKTNPFSLLNVLNKEEEIGSFCNSKNKRMHGTNGYQQRTQLCVVTYSEMGLDGKQVIRRADPNLIGYDQNCTLADNFENAILPSEESCCTCRIGYSAGFIAEPKNREVADVEGDDLDRPWNSYNNCRLCSAYGTFVFPEPPQVVVALLTQDYTAYNTAIDELITNYGAENVTLSHINNQIDLLKQKKAFLIKFADELRVAGDFLLNNENPIWIEDRFISIMGLTNETTPARANYYSIDSVRSDDYTPVDGDLIMIFSFAGLCANSETLSLAKSYPAYRRLREDLALPRVALNETSDSSFFPFNPLGMNYRPALHNGEKSFSSNVMNRFTEGVVGLVDNTVEKINNFDTTGTTTSTTVATPTTPKTPQQLKQHRSQYRNIQMNQALSSNVMESLVWDDLFEIGGKNASVFYNTDFAKQYFITNITSQAMYSPTCSDYYDCPHGRSPFIRDIDENDSSQTTTYVVIALSLIMLIFCVIFILYMAICASDPNRTYEPLHKDGKNPYASDSSNASPRATGTSDLQDNRMSKKQSALQDETGQRETQRNTFNKRPQSGSGAVELETM